MNAVDIQFKSCMFFDLLWILRTVSEHICFLRRLKHERCTIRISNMAAPINTLVQLKCKKIANF